MTNEASVGRFLAETKWLLAARLTETAIYVVVVGGLAAVGIVFGLAEPTATTLGFGVSVSADATPAMALFELGSAVVSIVAAYWLLAQFLTARARLHEGGSRFWPYLGMMILSILAVVVGLILLIVPGVILMIRWSAASGFVIGKREGVIDSLSASWAATKGHSWSIFFAAVVLFLIAILAGGILGALLGLFGELTVGIASAFAEAAGGAVFMALGIAIYSLVEDDTQQLAETFA